MLTKKCEVFAKKRKRKRCFGREKRKYEKKKELIVKDKKKMKIKKREI